LIKDSAGFAEIVYWIRPNLDFFRYIPNDRK
jgi:hypothetical protein